MRSKTTLKDIANEVGVSITIVSGVLNGHPVRVSEEKREEIVRVAKERKYLPNRIARSLVSRRSKTFGLIIPSIESRTYTSYTKNLEGLCQKEGFGLFIANTNDRLERDLATMAQLVERGVDGIFFVPSNESYESKELIYVLEDLPVPYVMVNRYLVNYRCDRVYFDNERGGYEATKLLLDNGHTKICCVANTSGSNTGRARFRGYVEALENHGLILRPEYLIESSYTMLGGYEAGEKVLKTDTTAIVAGSDYIALGLRRALQKRGRRVPEDYSLVSFDQSESDFLVDPPATTVIQNMSELARRSFELMNRRLAGEQGDPIEIVLDVCIRLGDTVRPLS
ncbi:LacI family DNA-binding transcriptional regulator [Thermophilibacter immobilis]|uniref:LacI family DNA-binding transcriptional regulator n=1 Tax=Thermophilibacter immobilis TaxID=2779519 RepID=A0A7S7M8C1_9ACTN|nr:LacI family DNA-binding transcriptional regulator [Thermophilibacter immobilis]QOY60554.1 LacI family DNA-binding transcriptional regulator [Thermophilibacter immobilis]